MNVELLDSRRLTGPNLYSDLASAVMDVAISGIATETLIGAWTQAVAELMSAMNWPLKGHIFSRVYEGGASLVFHAPIDVLYTGCELNEVALEQAMAGLRGEQPASTDEVIRKLTRQRDEEANPALLALQKASADAQLPFLWDDDEVSVGFGRASLVWPANNLPEPAEVDWDSTGTIPLGVVTGTNGKSTTVRLAASILAQAGVCAGITSTDYIRVGTEILDHGDYSGPGGARMLLRHPKSEAVVLEVARGGLLRRGIGVERANAALITNIAADHLGDYGINSVSDMTEAKFIVRRALNDNAPLILNADDEQSVRFAAGLSNRITWFSLDAEHPLIRAQMQRGGGAAFVSGDWLMLADNGNARRIVPVVDIPVGFGGAARYNISNSLGAMALCHVLGADDGALARGLVSFSGDANVNPGRGNLFVKNDVRIFIDFAHNEHGVRAVGETIGQFGAKRNIVLMGQAGDRSDKDIADLVHAICLMKPDLLLACNLPGYERGRESGVVAAMIRDLAISEGLAKEAVLLFESPLEGTQYVLSRARPGDCLVLLALTQRDEVLELVRDYAA